MFCYKCGCENGDMNKFCKKCGTPLKSMETQENDVVREQPAYQQPIYQEPAYQKPVYQQPVYQQPYNDPAMNAGNAYMNGMNQATAGMMNGYQIPMNPMKDFLSKPLYMVAVIGFSVMVLMSLIVKVMGLDSVYAKAFSVMQMMDSWGVLNFSDYGLSYWDLYDMLNQYLGVMNTGSVIMAILGAIPSILAAVGFWLVFVSAKDQTNPYMKTTGFTIVKVLKTISLVLIVLAALATVAAIVILGLAMNEVARYYSGSSVMPYMLILVVFSLIAYAVGVFYTLKLIKTIGSMRDAGAYAKPTCYISRFVAVMCIICGVVWAIGAVTSLLSPLVALSKTGMAVFEICMGILLFKIRGQMGER